MQLTAQLQNYEENLQNEWENFEGALKDWPDIFPDKFVSQALFKNIYAQVCTRCFGYGLDSTSMVPMADNLNHSCVEVTQELINL